MAKFLFLCRFLLKETHPSSRDVLHSFATALLCTQWPSVLRSESHWWVQLNGLPVYSWGFYNWTTAGWEWFFFIFFKKVGFNSILSLLLSSFHYFFLFVKLLSQFRLLFCFSSQGFRPYPILTKSLFFLVFKLSDVNTSHPLLSPLLLSYKPSRPPPPAHSPSRMHTLRSRTAPHLALARNSLSSGVTTSTRNMARQQSLPAARRCGGGGWRRGTNEGPKWIKSRGE